MKTTTSHESIISAVPFFMGEHPENSIVFISLRSQSAGVAMRADIPLDLIEEKFNLLIAALHKQEADHVAVLYYLPTHEHDISDLFETTKLLLGQAEVRLVDAIEIRDGLWRSLLCQDAECCSHVGKPLSHTPEIKGIKSEILSMVSRLEPINPHSEMALTHQREGALAVNDLIAEFSKNGVEASLALVARVLVYLLDLQVRDFALGVACDERQDEIYPLWSWMSTIASQGFLAPVSTLFAELAYERGEEVLAIRALERALIDNPDYQLAKLLRKTFAAKWSPAQFKAMRAELHPKICESLFGDRQQE